ncbi:uncharacterized protein AMSG_12007 [Thecamonas trahens ATCC 50062]|uniref:Major facilitator superfamily (MFS) profile domain-containing protein n=1 Tax=Thecamonas trahens ATCC 50062 TaxID=461836 RepID=A0A0L0DHL2_THETB|nr:hypothetical protein AMSG_12007 [Thecamonas trahens ATCC 50062]KNC50793.1 hypothetical protein AMSG_12007 [Thecamonas trahens ATCC 50062]|eukprot:XP_013756829.1 hypothetical protein AMSG_12007 [Thecamonas trahens ATCC 50062]
MSYSTDSTSSDWAHSLVLTPSMSTGPELEMGHSLPVSCSASERDEQTHPATSQSAGGGENGERKVTALPRAGLLVISIVVLSEAFSISMIYPFLARMVTSFGVAESQAQIAFYSGILAASFNLSQFASAFFWGRMSDARGRRTVLLIGLAANTVTILLFGLAKTFWWAVVARVFNGLANGNVGVAKSYLREISDETNATKAYSLVGLVWGVGMVIGPAFGGMLANFDETVPAVGGRGSPISEWPYLLPCIVSAVLNVVGFAIGWKHLMTTAQLRAHQASAAVVVTVETPSASSSANSLLTSTSTSTSGMTAEEEQEEVDAAGVALLSVQALDLDTVPLVELAEEKKTGRGARDEEAAGGEERPEPFRVVARRLAGNGNLILTVCVYAILSFADMLYDETFSIWAVLNPSEAGGAGYGFTQMELAVVFMAAGTTIVVAQGILMPKAIARFGVLASIRACLFGTAPLLVAYPLLGRLPPVIFWALLLLVALVRATLVSSAFTAIIVMTNSSVVPAELGVANGIAQSGASLSRTCGPFVGGVLLMWSLSGPKPWPINHHLVFVLGSLLHLAAGILTLYITPAINTPITEVATTAAGVITDAGSRKKGTLRRRWLWCARPRRQAHAYQYTAPRRPPSSWDADRLAEHMAHLVTFPTVSRKVGEVPEKSSLDAMHAYLRTTFPRVHEALERWEIGDSGSVVFVWRGSDAKLAPYVLAAHLDVVPADEPEEWSQPPFSAL